MRTVIAAAVVAATLIAAPAQADVRYGAIPQARTVTSVSMVLAGPSHRVAVAGHVRAARPEGLRVALQRWRPGRGWVWVATAYANERGDVHVTGRVPDGRAVRLVTKGARQVVGSSSAQQHAPH